MTPTRTRIGVLAAVFATGFGIVMLHLLWLMVHDNDVWARRSRENRWAFRSVPSQRGALRDRHGSLLAYDEPTTELAIDYVRFRQWHPVGAAVHGATTLARLRPGGEGTTYSYVSGALGPMAAAQDLLRMPTRLLRPRELPKDVGSELARVATTLLSACSGYPRSRVYGALRAASQMQDGGVIGDVLDIPAEQLLQAYSRWLHALTELDATIVADAARLAQDAIDPPEPPPGLIGTLERLRRASLKGEHVTWTAPDPKTHKMVVKVGSLIESVRRTFAENVPFELAAGLRIDAAKNPGIVVTPSVSRTCTEPRTSSLGVLLGTVTDLDRQDLKKDWFESLRDEVLPADWLDDLVPDGIADQPGDQSQLQLDVEAQYKHAMLLRERRGSRGMESHFDGELMGRLGMRLVERDSRRREHLLWSNLRVQPGEDVTLTIDVSLQHAAERAVQRQWRLMRDQYADEGNQLRVESALAVIDARTGDVLAYAGAPIVSPSVPDVPGVVWPGNGSIGSVVKPFVLVEELQAAAMGRPHQDLATIAPCSKDFRYGGRVLHCDAAHWDAGKDPVTALAKSCNSFFYQCGIGLGDEGLARALRRFGLLAPADAKDPFAACWQEKVVGLRIGLPRMFDKGVGAVPLPQRAIGYGVTASPLTVARAYAALATGCLPTVGFELGGHTERVQLDDIGNELEVVHRGMRQCVESGTGRHLTLLKEMQVLGKTGTAEVGPEGHQNNAWFAGFLPEAGQDGMQLCFCAVVYWVPNGEHGGEAAGQILVDFLTDLRADPDSNRRYLVPEGGR